MSENIPTPNGTSENTSEVSSLKNDTVVISVENKLEGDRLRNFYLTNVFQGFVWMLFHFSVVFFFGFLLESVALVGIFLGIANFVAFLIDIPLGIIQRYIPTKRLYIIAAISQLIATGIFILFIFRFTGLLEYATGIITPESLQEGKDWFFQNAFNWIAVLIASICYGITKEINDVSTFGYILSHSDPSQYGTILARMNITFGLGSLVGLILSGLILKLPGPIAVTILGIMIAGFLWFTIRYFDTNLESISLKDVDNFRISISRFSKENVKEYLVETVKKTDLSTILQKTKYLFIKPRDTEKIGQKVPWKSVAVESRKEFKIIWKIIAKKPPYLGMLWCIGLVLIFGFWDTFASSFLLDFLDQVKEGWSYILLAIIGVPGIILQEQASKLSEKIGVKTVGIIGLTLSGLSLLGMAILAMSEINPVILISVALINSLGYACGMSMGQNQFLDIYNRIYAEEEKLTEIDANASSGPMKVLQNLANVIGLVFGGLLIQLGFPAFFAIFGIIILGVLVWTIMKRQQIQV